MGPKACSNPTPVNYSVDEARIGPEHCLKNSKPSTSEHYDCIPNCKNYLAPLQLLNRSLGKELENLF